MMTLREHREERLLSIRELARAAGVTAATILDIEHGRRRAMWRTRRKIARALNVPEGAIAEFATPNADNETCAQGALGGGDPDEAR